MVYLIFVATHGYCASYILHTNATVCPVPVGCFGQTPDASLLALCIFLHLLLRSVSMELVSNTVAFREGNSSGNKAALTPTQLYWQHFVNDLTTTGVDSEEPAAEQANEPRQQRPMRARRGPCWLTDGNWAT
jgi:hypothetical protein